MRFRTEIESLHPGFKISIGTKVAFVGSCFADEIRARLSGDGISASGGELGPLFNPASIARAIERIGRAYTADDLTEHEGVYHCLDWANRYQDADTERLLARVNKDFEAFSAGISEADVVIITFGNTKVYEYQGVVAGNCHKLPGGLFESRRLCLEEIVDQWRGVDFGKRKVVMTLSPVRYTENGLSQSTLAKATLRVAIDRICAAQGWEYFPAFEIVNDDLRDYRFYGRDLKHPSEMAVDYIYEKFCEAYMSADTRRAMQEQRKLTLTLLHRPNISDL